MRLFDEQVVKQARNLPIESAVTYVSCIKGRGFPTNGLTWSLDKQMELACPVERP